jgi:hypothetical protein
LGKREGRDNLVELSVNGSITLKRVFQKWEFGGMDRIILAQDMDM